MEHHGVQPISPDVDDEARAQDINTKASEFLVNTVSLARREEPLLQETAHENTEAVVATEEEADFFSSDSDVILLDSSMEVKVERGEVEGEVKEEAKEEVKSEVKDEVRSEMKEEVRSEVKGGVKEEAKKSEMEEVKEEEEEIEKKSEEMKEAKENASHKNEQPIEHSLPVSPAEVPLAEALTYPTTQSPLALQDTEPECPPQPRVTRMVSSPATRENPYSDTHERSPISPLFQTKRRNFVVNHPSIDTQRVQSRVWDVHVVC